MSESPGVIAATIDTQPAEGGSRFAPMKQKPWGTRPGIQMGSRTSLLASRRSSPRCSSVPGRVRATGDDRWDFPGNNPLCPVYRLVLVRSISVIGVPWAGQSSTRGRGCHGDEVSRSWSGWRVGPAEPHALAGDKLVVEGPDAGSLPVRWLPLLVVIPIVAGFGASWWQSRSPRYLVIGVVAVVRRRCRATAWGCNGRIVSPSPRRRRG